jgi:hypothetical protein
VTNPTATDASADTSADLQLALSLATIADVITLGRFTAHDLRVHRKPDRTPVTDADLTVEDAIRALPILRRSQDMCMSSVLDVLSSGSFHTSRRISSRLTT